MRAILLGVCCASALAAARGQVVPLRAVRISGGEAAGLTSLATVATANSNLVRFGATAGMPSMSPDGTTGVLDVYASTIFGIRVHSESSNAITASSTDGQAGKFIQGGTGAHSSIAVLRLWRSNTNASVTSPLLAMSDAAALGSGGPLLRAEKAGAPAFAIDASGRLLLRSPNGSWWRVSVSDAGAVTVTSTSAP